MAKLLIVDDERAIRNTLRDILEFEQYEIDEAPDGPEALTKLKDGDYDLVLCDVKMPKLDGLDVIKQAFEELKDPPQFIMISGHGNIETAVEATKLGAFDFIEKPPDLNRLLVAIRNALDKSNLVQETKRLRKKVAKTPEIIGESEGIQEIKATIEKIAPTDARVLITGPNGTGKELVARWIHTLSNRAGGNFVEVNCAAIPSELIESELFGHEKGSFTGAHKQRIGKFEQASGGTLFLDEIGDMSADAQAKVLRALQEGLITRVGGDKPIRVDVRVVAATNKDLLHEVEEGSFREDLYHRLGVILIHVPSLNDRRDDIPAIADSFVQDLCEEYNMAPKTLTEEAQKALMALDWRGNVRELRNTVERLVIFAEKKITGADVRTYATPHKPRKAAKGGLPIDDFDNLADFRDYAEKLFLEKKLEANAWNISQTAEAVGIQRSHLYNKLEKYGLKKPE